jgi:predicted Fe-Mo cluster-binding NifX family protein
MRICMPTVDANGFESSLSGHFGSAPYFALYDTESNKVSMVINDHDSHAHGSCMPVEMLQEHHAEIVLCKGMGMRAVDLLKSAGIKVFLVEAATVKEAIDKFNANQIKPLTLEAACQGHDCK